MQLSASIQAQAPKVAPELDEVATARTDCRVVQCDPAAARLQLGIAAMLA